MLHENINIKLKIGVEDVTEENYQGYKEALKTPYKDAVSIFQLSLFWRLLLKKTHKKSHHN